MIEHNLENLIALADRMILLSEGKVVLDDATDAFFQEIELLIEKGISPPGAMRFFYELNRLGLYTGGFPLTVEEGYATLTRIFQKDPP